MRLQEFVEDEVFSPTLIAGALWTTKSEIASTLGLGQDAFSRAARVRARKIQTRLREMLEISSQFAPASVFLPCQRRSDPAGGGAHLLSH